MITKRVLWGLIGVTAATLAFNDIALQQYPLAVFTGGLGLLWLVLEIRGENPVVAVFFLVFSVLAMASASQGSTPVPLALLGLSMNLAAWDLSRFRARIAGETASETRTALEISHLRNLGVTVGAGFFIALLPLYIQVAIPFVLFCGVVLLAMTALRQSIRLVHDGQIPGSRRSR